MYNVGHEGRSNLFDLGIFGGSNGMWKAEVLQRIRMDGDMLTEDIDSSFRAHLQGYKVTYCDWSPSSTMPGTSEITC